MHTKLKFDVDRIENLSAYTYEYQQPEALHTQTYIRCEEYLNQSTRCTDIKPKYNGLTELKTETYTRLTKLQIEVRE